jgi:hypothetical protein
VRLSDRLTNDVQKRGGWLTQGRRIDDEGILGSVMERPKYRLRTSLREVLPERVAVLIPKGSDDCGDHEWYQAEDDHTWRCFHCLVGVTHEVPWDDRELEARQLEGDAMLLRAGLPRHHHTREAVH